MKRVGSILFLSASMSALLGQETQTGFVLAVQGQWKWASKQGSSVKAGDPVSENSTARVAGPRGKLTIGMLDGSVRAFACPPLDPCVAAIGSFRRPPESLYGRLLSVAKTFFAQRDAMPVYAMSRGASTRQFHYAVLVLANNSVDISPAVAQLDAGIYGLRLQPLIGSPEEHSANLTWAPPTTTTVQLEGLKPGAYDLIITSTDGRRIGSTPVIVGMPGRVDSQRSALDQGLRIAESWPPDTDPAAVHNFLTALVLSIAQEGR